MIFDLLLSPSMAQAAQLLTMIDGGTFTELTNRLGFKFDTADISIAFGTGRASPAIAAAAFAPQVNAGHTITPHLIARVVDAHGKILYRAPVDSSQGFKGDEAGQGMQVFSPQTAYILHEALRDMQRTIAVKNDDAPTSPARLLRFGGVAAASNDLRDGWYIAAQRDVVTAL